MNCTSVDNVEDYGSKPVIGILTQNSFQNKIFRKSEYSYIASSYVKYIESAGARVVPIKYNIEKDSMNEILGKLNGILLPGGGSSLFNFTLLGLKKETQFTALMNASKFIIDYAIEQNNKGNPYPIWGTCLGFEIMLLAISKNARVLTAVNNTNISKSIHYLNTSKDSKLLSEMTERMKTYVNKEPVFYFNHKFAITPDSFFGNKLIHKENEDISKFYTPLAVNDDQCGKTFISIIEAKKYPFYGVQFHPEKGSFEWKSNFDINHSPGAIEADRYFAYYFIEEARKNKNVFPDTLEWNKKLIYNYYPIQFSSSWNSIYIFSNPNQNEKFLSKYKISPKIKLNENDIFIEDGEDYVNFQ